MNSLTKLLLLSAICIAVITFTAELAFAATDATDATCAIDCTVAGQLEWSDNFTAISIVEELTEQNDQITGSGTTTLWTNGNVTLTTAGAAIAQLVADPEDFLVTEYQLEYDGDGVTATGGSTVAYALHSAFITGAGSAVTHFSTDGAVVLTLTVRASHDTDNVANADDYTATQTITATWNP